MDLSIVIVSWNTQAILLDCLKTVRENTLHSKWQTEVFVVDNASDDGSAQAVRDEFPEVRVIENDRNLGFASANNVALKFACGRYCLLLNSDTLVPEGTFDELITVMDSRGKTAVCSPLLLNADATPQICWAKFPGLRSELTGRLDRSQSPYPLETFPQAEARAAMRPFPVDWVGGACFLVRRRAMQQVGLLDERFFMFGEEVEWCHRFARHGWQVLMVPGVTVTHLGGQSTRAVPVETRRQMYHSTLRLYKILYGPVGAWLPCAIAGFRFWLSPLRRSRRPVEPVQ